MREVFIFGDSHAGALRLGFVARGWKTFGGTFQAGVEYQSPFFDLVDDRLQLRDGDAQEKLTRDLARTRASHLGELDIPIVATVGFNSRRLANELSRQRRATLSKKPPTWSRAVVEAVVASVRAPAMAFYAALPASRTFAVLSPQRVDPRAIAMLHLVEDIFAAEVARLGVAIIDVRDRTTSPDGTLRPEFWNTKEGDRMHANAAYGEIVADRLAELLAGAHAPV